MKNSSTKIVSTLSLLVISSAFAQDIKYTLEFSGDSISRSLIRNNEVENKNDLTGIQNVLDYNNLNWEMAKKLPIGFEFYVQRNSEEIKLTQESSSPESENSPSKNTLSKRISQKKISSSKSFSVEAGTFYHTQQFNDANIYSDLSQYALIGYNHKDSYYFDAGIQRFQYSDDSAQNIESGTIEYKYSVSGFKTFKAGTFDLNLGAYTRNLLAFDLDQNNAVEFQSANSSGLEFRAQSNFFEKGKYSLFAGLGVQKNIASGNLEDFLSSNILTGVNFESFKRKLSVVLRYNVSSLEFNSEEVDEQVASLGLKTLF